MADSAMPDYLVEQIKEDFFYLFVYAVPLSALHTGTASAISHESSLPWLEQNGAPVQDEIPFKQTHCFKFFSCLHSLIDEDLLRLVGGSVAEKESADDAYCFGCLPHSEVDQIIGKMEEMLTSRREEAGTRAESYDLHGRWFLRTAMMLQEILKEVREKQCAPFGYFE